MYDSLKKTRTILSELFTYIPVFTSLEDYSKLFTISFFIIYYVD